MLHMDLEYDAGILYVRLKGKLNRKTSYKINNYLNPVIVKHRVKYLVYNCEYLSDIDATGIDAINNTKYLIKNNNGKIRVCTKMEKIKKVFKYLKIPHIKNEAAAKDIVGEK